MLKEIIIRYAENIDALRDFVYSINELLDELPDSVIRAKNPELAESIDTFISDFRGQSEPGLNSSISDSLGDMPSYVELKTHGVTLERTSDEIGPVISFNLDDVRR